MIRVVWKFEVRPERVAEFESVYGPDGDWAQLFRRSSFYGGTELIKKDGSTAVYEVIDLWQSLESYTDFKVQNRSDYDSLDKRCEQLTIKETPLGHFQEK